ncbi:MAG: hypothetical protein RSB47_08110 [Ruthenibacterium sp.]
MKKNQKIATTLCTVLFVLQLFVVRYVVNNAAITSVAVSMFIEIGAVIAFAIVAIKLAAGEGDTCSFKKKLVAGAVLYTLATAVYYDIALNIIMAGLSMFGEALVATPVYGIVVLVVKFVLLAAVIYFVCAPEKETQASIEFETAPDAAELQSPEKVEEITEKLDEVEQ